MGALENSAPHPCLHPLMIGSPLDLSASIFLFFSTELAERSAETSRVRRRPTCIRIQSLLRTSRIPGVSISAPLRDLVHVIVDGLAPVAEDRLAGADVVVARPDRTGAGLVDQLAP